MWRAGGARDLPLAERSVEWNADEAENRVRRWAGGPDRESMDWSKYARAFLAVDDERAEEFAGYKLPFADIVDGQLMAVPQALFAVAAALMGARGGVDLPQDVQDEIKERVAAYYHRIEDGLKAPWEQEERSVRVGRVLSERNRKLIEEAIRQSTEAIEALSALLREVDERETGQALDRGLEVEQRRAVLEALRTVRTLESTEDMLRVGGYGVVWGGRDLYATYFTPRTDFWLDRVAEETPVLYDHGFDAQLGVRVIGKVVRKKIDGIGMWVEAQIKLHEEYMRALSELLSKNVLGWSSGSAAHLVDIAPDGEIRRWPLVEFSLTPTPAEPRTLGVQELRNLGVDIATVEALETASREATEVEGGGAVDASGDDVAIKQETGENKMSEEILENKDNAIEEQAVKAQPAEERPAEERPAVNGLFSVKKVSRLGDAQDSALEFVHYLRTGQATRATAWQEGTAGEGGYLVPEDMYDRVITAVAEKSIPRAMGATVIRTSRDVINVPVMSSLDKMVITAEEAAYDESTVTPFAQKAITVYKFTRLVKVSEELLEDSAFNVEQLLTAAIADAWAATENYYALVGTGSGQPEGVLAGGTLGVTAASASTIAADEVQELYFALSSLYRGNLGVVWVMADATEGVIRALQASSTAGQFLFQQTPAGSLGNELLGKRVWNSSAMPAIAAGAKTIVFGDWAYYALVERGTLVIQRNPYLYQASGQVGFFAKVRFGGAVLKSSAFQYLQQASA